MVIGKGLSGSPRPPAVPISVTGPSEADLQRSVELEKLLLDSGHYESKGEAVRREEVLGQIDQIVKAWVKQLTRQRGEVPYNCFWRSSDHECYLSHCLLRFMVLVLTLILCVLGRPTKIFLLYCIIFWLPWKK